MGKPQYMQGLRFVTTSNEKWNYAKYFSNCELPLWKIHKTSFAFLWTPSVCGYSTFAKEYDNFEYVLQECKHSTDEVTKKKMLCVCVCVYNFFSGFFDE